LHDGAARFLHQTHGKRRSHYTFLPDDRDFHASSVAGEYDERSQTLIQEVCKFNFFRRLVQDEMVRELNRFEIWPDKVISTDRQRQQEQVSAWLIRPDSSRPGDWLRFIFWGLGTLARLQAVSLANCSIIDILRMGLA
jgi:hypothetical protein